jgi:hypothetical protein
VREWFRGVFAERIVVRRGVLTIVLIGLTLLAQLLASNGMAHDNGSPAGTICLKATAAQTQSVVAGLPTSDGDPSHRHDAACLYCASDAPALSLVGSIGEFEPEIWLDRRAVVPNRALTRAIVSSNPNAPTRAGPVATV